MAVEEPAAPPASRPGLTRHARRVSVAVAGGATIAVGVALLPLPGPGTLVIIAGLSILGREFPKARKAADRGKDAATTAVKGVARGAGRVGTWFKREDPGA